MKSGALMSTIFSKRRHRLTIFPPNSLKQIWPNGAVP